MIRIDYDLDEHKVFKGIEFQEDDPSLAEIELKGWRLTGGYFPDDGQSQQNLYLREDNKLFVQVSSVFHDENLRRGDKFELCEINESDLAEGGKFEDLGKHCREFTDFQLSPINSVSFDSSMDQLRFLRYLLSFKDR